MKKENKQYYFFNEDGTLGYVGYYKMLRLIKGWGWKRKDFVTRNKIKKLFS